MLGNQTKVNHEILLRSCFIFSSNLPLDTFSFTDILSAYKQQDKVEKGFAFLKSPSFFASSLFLKNPSRIQGLLMVMNPGFTYLFYSTTPYQSSP